MSTQEDREWDAHWDRVEEDQLENDAETQREQAIIDREREVYEKIMDRYNADDVEVEDYDLTDHLELNMADGSIVSITVTVTLP